MSSQIQKILVVAIDVGTTYSGYAYSFMHEYNEDPTVVNRNLPWNYDRSLPFTQPTCVLCNPKREFSSFGYEAEKRYSELSEKEERHKWYFFRRFKLMLQEKQVNMGFELEDEKGLKMPAIKVFAMAIRYWKDIILNWLEKSGTDLRVNNILWVLPVPTTWTVSAKNFLREAAKEAGIDGRLLTIVLESKAAAIYSKLCMPHDCSNRTTFDDTKYIVTDLGDERIHTTVLENELAGVIKVVYTVSDRSIGGKKIDEAYNQMIIEIIGSLTFKKFCEENNDDYMDMLTDISCKKRNIRMDSVKTISVRLPIVLMEMYEKRHNQTVKDAIAQSNFRGKITVGLDKMRFGTDLFRSFFKNTISEITKHLADVLKRTDAKGTTALIVVGQLSIYPIIQDTMKKAFPGIKVIIPNDGTLAVLNGAVVFGHRLSETANLEEDHVSSSDIANLSTCSSSFEQGIRHPLAGNMKEKSLSEEGEDDLSSDYVEMSMQKQDKGTTALETQLVNQMTLKTDVERAPSDDELFTLSRKLEKFNEAWWLLAKLLGLSDEKIDEMEHDGGHSVRRYYNMLTAWKKQNSGQDKGSVRYLLKQCDEAGVDREVTTSVFGN